MQFQNLKNLAIRHAKVITVLSVLTLMIFIGGLIGKVQAETKTVVVDCDAGQTIGNALQLGADWKAIKIIVKGTCEENIIIQRDDVTLQGEGGALDGVVPNESTIQIYGARGINIDNLLVSGDGTGVAVFSGASLRLHNSTIIDNARAGVAVLLGSSAIIDGVTVELSGSDGIYIEDSTATIYESIIRENDSSGVRVAGSGNAKIGLTEYSQPSSNVIEDNTRDGISVFNGAHAFIYGNTIQRNERYGVGVGNASAMLIGDNTITSSANHAVSVLRGGMLLQGKGDFPFDPGPDTITASGGYGISTFNNATLEIRNAIVRGSSYGIYLNFHSTLRIYGSNTNISGGILLAKDSGLFLGGPNVGPPDVDSIECWDVESSVLGDNSEVDYILNCTDFNDITFPP
jgi:hypothetical protein